MWERSDVLVDFANSFRQADPFAPHGCLEPLRCDGNGADPLRVPTRVGGDLVLQRAVSGAGSGIQGYPRRVGRRGPRRASRYLGG